MTVLSDGDRVHLVDRKGRQYALTLKAGDTFQFSGETLAHDDLIGRPDGTLVTLSRGRRMLALRPTLSEYVLKMPRGAQVLYPKDLGVILQWADIYPGARVFEARTGHEIAVVNQVRVNAVAFSPDGTLLVTGSDDASARVFGAHTGFELSRLAHQGAVNAVAFSPDGTLVGTASSDKTARLFEGHTGRELARLPHEDAVRSVSFSPGRSSTSSGSATGATKSAAASSTSSSSTRHRR